MTQLYLFSKYLISEVLQWQIVDWKVQEDKDLAGRATLSFIAKKPLQREAKDWSKDPYLVKHCTNCFATVEANGIY